MCLLAVNAKPQAGGEMRVSVPILYPVAVEHIHDRRILIRHHKMWDPSPGVDAPRSEHLAALRQFSMQDPGYGVPRIQLPRTRVHKELLVWRLPLRSRLGA